MRHHQTLDVIPPWRRREVARNTAHKCEKGEWPKGSARSRRRRQRNEGRRALRRASRED